MVSTSTNGSGGWVLSGKGENRHLQEWLLEAGVSLPFDLSPYLRRAPPPEVASGGWAIPAIRSASMPWMKISTSRSGFWRLAIPLSDTGLEYLPPEVDSGGWAISLSWDEDIHLQKWLREVGLPHSPTRCEDIHLQKRLLEFALVMCTTVSTCIRGTHIQRRLLAQELIPRKQFLEPPNAVRSKNGDSNSFPARTRSTWYQGFSTTAFEPRYSTVYLLYSVTLLHRVSGHEHALKGNLDLPKL